MLTPSIQLGEKAFSLDPSNCIPADVLERLETLAHNSMHQQEFFKIVKLDTVAPNLKTLIVSTKLPFNPNIIHAIDHPTLNELQLNNVANANTQPFTTQSIGVDCQKLTTLVGKGVTLRPVTNQCVRSIKNLLLDLSPTFDVTLFQSSAQMPKLTSLSLCIVNNVKPRSIMQDKVFVETIKFTASMKQRFRDQFQLATPRKDQGGYDLEPFPDYP